MPLIVVFIKLSTNHILPCSSNCHILSHSEYISAYTHVIKNTEVEFISEEKKKQEGQLRDVHKLGKLLSSEEEGLEN